MGRRAGNTGQDGHLGQGDDDSEPQRSRELSGEQKQPKDQHPAVSQVGID